MSSRFAKMIFRKGTKGKYDDTTRSLPAPQETTITTEVTPETKKKTEDDKIDSTVEEEHQVEDTDANTDVKGKQTARKAVDGVLKNKIGTDSAGKPQGVYSRLWKQVTDYKLSPVRYTTVAWYVPNCMPYRPLIESCCKLVGQSNHAQKHEKEFLPYAFAVGIYYLESIQILRAQKAAGELVGQSLSALARFEKYNSLESIMIPEPFIPLLESLAAVELEDVKYHWIVPQHRLDFTNATTFADICDPDVIDLFRPNIPFMLANLASFGCTTRANLANRIDAARTFTPIELKPTDNANAIQPVRFIGANRTFDGAIAANTAIDTRNVIQMCGASFPFHFWNDNFYDAHLGLRNSRFFVQNGVDIGLTSNLNHPDTGNALNDGTKVFNNLDAYLFIAKSNNPSWFQYLSEQINIVARFFPGSRPMSKIAVTGGMEPTVLCHLKLEDHPAAPAAAAADYIYADLQLGMQNYNAFEFYQDRFRSLTAAFTTTRGDIERNEELNAFALGICADPPVATAIPAANANSVFRGGRFFNDAHLGGTHMRAQRLGFTEATIPGDVPMYNGWHDDFVKPAFSKTPTNA